VSLLPCQRHSSLLPHLLLEPSPLLKVLLTSSFLSLVPLVWGTFSLHSIAHPDCHRLFFALCLSNFAARRLRARDFSFPTLFSSLCARHSLHNLFPNAHWRWCSASLAFRFSRARLPAHLSALSVHTKVFAEDSSHLLLPFSSAMFGASSLCHLLVHKLVPHLSPTGSSQHCLRCLFSRA
jgi:hypothetical protein